MAKRITVVLSQGQSAHPDKRKLEEDLVAALLFENGVDVTVVPNLYDLAPGSTGMLCLEGIKGDMVVLSWLFPRAAHWTLDRHNVRGNFGQTLLAGNDDEEDEDEDSEEDGAQAASDSGEEAQDGADEGDDKPATIARPLPARTIYHLDLRSQPRPEPYIAEVKRILAETSVETISLLGSFSTTLRPLPVSPDANGTSNQPAAAANNPAAGFINLLGGAAASFALAVATK